MDGSNIGLVKELDNAEGGDLRLAVASTLLSYASHAFIADRIGGLVVLQANNMRFLTT